MANARAKEMVENILSAVSATEYELWLSGPNNFRYNVYPEYKANRIGAYRPKWERAVKNYLVAEWKANWSDGCEADDMVGVRQMDAPPETTIIAHIDKDIDMIPGWHYNWPLIRKGKVLREGVRYFVDEAEAEYNFYYQLIVGDKGTDNIPGLVGKGPVFAKKFLATIPRENWLKEILELYSCKEELEMNAKCLWIWRKMDDIWQWPEGFNK